MLTNRPEEVGVESKLPGLPFPSGEIVSHILECPECVLKPHVERDVRILAAIKIVYFEAQPSQQEDDCPNVSAAKAMP